MTSPCPDDQTGISHHEALTQVPPNSQRVSELLFLWEELHAKGDNVAPEALCQDCPELIEPLRKQIAALGVVSIPTMPFATPGFLRPEVPGYEVLEELGRGGMGIVYKARQVRLNRLVAIKMIQAGSLATQEEQARFRREAEAVASLGHSGIVQIYEVGEVQGRVYFTMEYLAGGSLADRLRSGFLSWRDAAQLVASLAGAVQHAHDRKIIHRDLKPGNVLLGEQPTVGTPTPGSTFPCSAKITDFGLAKSLHAEEASPDNFQTLTGKVFGTPAYMAPEQARGKAREVGPACDVYALGGILYACLTGRPPFQGTSDHEILAQVIERDPVTPRALQPAIPRDLETICLKCLEKQATRRYASARDLALDLGRFLRGETIVARPASKIEKVYRWAARNKLSAGLLFSLVTLLVTGTVAAIVVAYTQHQLAVTASKARGEAEQLAIEKARVAEEAKLARSEAENLLLARYRDRADELYLEDNLPRALNWIGEGLRLTRDDPERQLPYRQRMASVLLQRTPFVRTWFHEAEVRAIDVSPDGKRVVTGSEDWTAQVWDIASGQAVGQSMLHTGPVRVVEFSKDEQFVLTGSAGLARAVARVWDATTGKPVTSRILLEGNLAAASFSPDNRHVLLASGGGTARVWDARTGIPAGPRLHHPQGIHCAQFHPAGTLVLTGGHDGRVRIWNHSLGQLIREGFAHNRDIVCLATNDTGTILATGSYDSNVRLWNLATGTPHELTPGASHQGGVTSLDFAFGMEILATGSQDHHVRLLDHGRKILRRLSGHRGPVTSVRFSPSANRLLSASQDRTARQWPLAPGSALTSPLQHSGSVWQARFTPDETHALTASSDGTARLWRLLGSGLHLRVNQGHIRQVAFSPDGTLILTAGHDGIARLWDARTGKRVGEDMTHGKGMIRDKEILSARISPDGNWIATASLNGTARIWDARTGKPRTAELNHEHGVVWIEFSPDGRHVATVTGSTTRDFRGNTRVWDAASGKLLAGPFESPSKMETVQFDPQGNRLVSVSRNSAIIRDWRSGKELLSLQHPIGFAMAFFSPDGERLLTSNGVEANLWDARTGRRLGAPMSHVGHIRYVAFSPTGDRVVTAGDDHVARIWDGKSGAPLTPPLDHTARVFHAAFSPDGKRVITGGEGAFGMVWDARTGESLSAPLKTSGWINWTAFSPDGKRVLTGGGAGFPGGETILWELGSEERPIEDLLDIIEVLSCERRGEPGKFLPLESERFRETYTRLAKKYPTEFPGDPRRRPDWPAKHQVQEGRRLGAVRQYSQAIEAYSRAIALGLDTPLVRAERAYWYEAASQGEQALADLDRVQAASLDEVDYVSTPGWLYHACRLIEQGKLADHARLCLRMEAIFAGKAESPTVRAYIAALACLAPAPPLEIHQILELAQVGLNAKPDHSTYQRIMALAYYRAGRYDDALRIARTSVESKVSSGTIGWATLALIEHARGQRAEAEGWLAKAIKSEASTPPETGIARVAALERALLLAEARRRLAK